MVSLRADPCTAFGSPGRSPSPWAAGVFVAGDVGSGSVKRVAFAVGEGAMAIRLVREHRAGVR